MDVIADSKDGSCVTAEDEEEAEEEAAKPKKKETVWEWELLNDAKPIWLRSPGDVSEEEYAKFYQAISKVCTKPMLKGLSLSHRRQVYCSPAHLIEMSARPF